MITDVEEQRGEAGEHSPAPDEATHVFGVVDTGHVCPRQRSLDVVVQTEQRGGVHDDQRGDVEQDQQCDVHLVIIVPNIPAAEAGAHQLHWSHHIEHEPCDGHVDEVHVGHGHRHLVGQVDHHQQHIVAQPQREAHQEVDKGEDGEDEAKVLAQLLVHTGVCLIVNQAHPHRGLDTGHLSTPTETYSSGSVTILGRHLVRM